MKQVVITGAFGNVGKSAIAACLANGHKVIAFDYPSSANKRVAKKYAGLIEVRWGDIRNVADVGESLKDADAVIHLAAIIPPLSDRKPVYAKYVNVGGTENVIRAMEAMPNKPVLVFASSIAVYGDRLNDPPILASDPVTPNEDDPYGHFKVECERMIAASSLPWTVLRLSAIFSSGKLVMDPLMFHMPLSTKIEICDSSDAGRAFANAVDRAEARGRILNIGGGEQCRTTYRQFLDSMLSLFGLGRGFLPEEAFAKRGFHCNWLGDSDASEAILGFRTKNLERFYQEVRDAYRPRRFGLSLVRLFARAFVLSRSDFLKDFTVKTGTTIWRLLRRTLPVQQGM